MNKLYRSLRQQARGCRDRDVRIRLELILMAMKLGNVSLACSRMGFSRRFYYRWYQRLKKSGWDLDALVERSRRPKRSPGKISSSLEKAIDWYERRQHGARMTQAYLAREGMRVSRTTICHVRNKRRRPIKQRRQKLKKHRKRYELLVPGQRLQVDVKYAPEKVDGQRVYVYVAVDECTRWRFALGFDSLCEGSTVKFLEALKINAPFPINTIQTDNGFEFTYSLNILMKNRVHAMDEWCAHQGIKHRLIPPGAKELNGKVERSHRIDEQYFYWKAPTSNLASFNLHLKRWMAFYNHKRLHQGLGYNTPWEKLLERRQTLSTTKIEASLEPLRLRFVAYLPTYIQTKQDWQLEKVKKSLEAILKAA